VCLGDEPARRQADAETRHVARVAALHHVEHALAQGRRDARPVVVHRQRPRVVVAVRGDPDLRAHARSGELHRVRHEILHEDAQQGGVADELVVRGIHRHCRLRDADRGVEVGEGVGQHRAHRHGSRRRLRAAERA
jgi:hypothetical protein